MIRWIVYLTMIYIYCWQGFDSCWARIPRSVDMIDGLQYNKKWATKFSDPQRNLNYLFGALEQSEHGKMILMRATQKAREMGMNLEEIVVAGRVSYTDTTLLRQFKKSHPDKVTYQQRAKVYINSDMVLRDAVLDLAHELIHFSLRDSFNPYDENFNLKAFMHSTIEATGGEVDAYLAECQVMKDLFKKDFLSSQCQEVISNGQFSRELAIKKFYRIGELYSHFFKDTKIFNVSPIDFPQLSHKDPVFISSVYSLPYPMATFLEFKNVMKNVCDNDLRRLSMMEEKLGRLPASKDLSLEDEVYQKMEKSYQKRCYPVLGKTYHSKESPQDH